MNIIDIHAHYVAPELIALVEREGARHHVTVSLTGDGKRQFRVGEGAITCIAPCDNIS
jgi:hypothetical protein